MSFPTSYGMGLPGGYPQQSGYQQGGLPPGTQVQYTTTQVVYTPQQQAGFGQPQPQQQSGGQALLVIPVQQQGVPQNAYGLNSAQPGGIPQGAYGFVQSAGIPGSQGWPVGIYSQY